MFIKTQPRSAWGTLWGFLRTLAFEVLIMSAILGAIGLTVVSLAAFSMWDLAQYGDLDGGLPQSEDHSRRGFEPR